MWVSFRRFAWAQHGLAGPSLAQLVWVRPAVKRIFCFVCLHRRVLFWQALARFFVVVASLWLLLACVLACLLWATQRFLLSLGGCVVFEMLPSPRGARAAQRCIVCVVSAGVPPGLAGVVVCLRFAALRSKLPPRVCCCFICVPLSGFIESAREVASCLVPPGVAHCARVRGCSYFVVCVRVFLGVPSAKSDQS